MRPTAVWGDRRPHLCRILGVSATARVGECGGGEHLAVEPLEGLGLDAGGRGGRWDRGRHGDCHALAAASRRGARSFASMRFGTCPTTFAVAVVNFEGMGSKFPFKNSTSSQL